MNVEKTDRGFEIVKFRDANDVKCSIQQSSAIGNRPEDFDNPGSSFLWIGCNDANPQVMAIDAIRLGVKTDKTTGWVPYDNIPDDVLMTTRMHLNRDQVRELIPILQNWLDTGYLSKE